MKRRKLVILFIVLLIAITIVMVNKTSEPFKLVYKMNSSTVEDHELITKENTRDGILIFSAGKVNNGEDNFYLVDMVKKSLLGYKWTGGGGHISRDIINNKDFIISAQLLNENQNISPTLFGVIKDANIKNITIETKEGLFPASIYNGIDENERFYILVFENDIANERYFIFKLIYNDDTELEFFIADEINMFQQGMTKYFSLNK